MNTTTNTTHPTPLTTPSSNFTLLPTYTTPPTYILATAIILSILLIFIGIGFWIYFSTSSKNNIAPKSRSLSGERYTTRPGSAAAASKVNRLSSTTKRDDKRQSWFRGRLRSPTLPLFRRRSSDLTTLGEVLWSCPDDGKRSDTQRFCRSASSMETHSRTSIALDIPATAHLVTSGLESKPSLLARRHVPASRQPLALALPAVAHASGTKDRKTRAKGKDRAAQKGKEKRKSGKSNKMPATRSNIADLNISSPRVRQSVAERLAQRYQLVDPRYHEGALDVVVGDGVKSTTTTATLAPMYNHVNDHINTNTASATSHPVQRPHVASDAPSSTHPSITAVISPTIIHRRLLTSGLTDGDVVNDLKSPYSFTLIPSPQSFTHTPGAEMCSLHFDDVSRGPVHQITAATHVDEPERTGSAGGVVGRSKRRGGGGEYVPYRADSSSSSKSMTSIDCFVKSSTAGTQAGNSIINNNNNNNNNNNTSKQATRSKSTTMLQSPRSPHPGMKWTGSF